MKKIAVVCADGLGDGLLSLVFAHNLEQQAYEVTTFSNYLPQLQAWFPDKKIAPLPKLEDIDMVFSSYDRIISTDGAFLTRVKHNLGSHYAVYYERDFDRNKTVLQNFLSICQRDFGVSGTSENIGLKALDGLRHRFHRHRIIIHPMSTCDTKNWPAEKFINLAGKLKRKGFEPIFIMSPKEQILWQPLLQNKFSLPAFPSLNELAKFIYESGYFIGNDSGIGHLAANLGLPTLSLFSRLSVANLWRPNGDKAVVITATLQLPGARLRTKYWKKLLTVNKVMNAFEKMSRADVKV